MILKIETGQKTFKLIIYNFGGNPKKSINSPYNRILDAKDLNERQIKALNNLQKSKLKSVSRGEYMKLTSSVSKTASRDLDNLVKRGLLRRYGSKRATRYVVLLER